jgi:hypothetical protein
MGEIITQFHRNKSSSQEYLFYEKITAERRGDKVFLEDTMKNFHLLDFASSLNLVLNTSRLAVDTIYGK